VSESAESRSGGGEPPAKLPLAVRRGPPITVTCECGGKRELHYGERWQCEGCGRRYDTSRIPLDEYAAIRRAQMRQLVAPAVVALLVLAGALTLVLSGRAVLAVVIVPLAGYLWSQWVRPVRRRRRYEELSKLPRWDLEAD